MNKLHYLEIVAADVDAVCRSYQATLGLEFGAPEPLLGNARCAALPDGGRLGVRAPMSEAETPLLRPYWLVDDLEQAVQSAAGAGCVIAHPPLEIPGYGKFAILIQGGVQQGLWQL